MTDEEFLEYWTTVAIAAKLKGRIAFLMSYEERCRLNELVGKTWTPTPDVTVIMVQFALDRLKDAHDRRRVP